MTVLARVVRFLFWLLVVSWSVWLLRRVFGWMLRNGAPVQTRHEDAAGQQASGASRRLVRDPVCGIHVDETLSIPMREGGELLHFCSIACRDAYLSGTKKFVANA